MFRNEIVFTIEFIFIKFGIKHSSNQLIGRPNVRDTFDNIKLSFRLNWDNILLVTTTKSGVLC